MKGEPVNESHKMETPVRLHAQRARPTIGLLINASIGGVLEPQWSGVADKAQELGVNLICFAGNVLRTPLPFEGQANAVYDLASPENVDGLVIWTAGMNWYVSPEEMASFCQRYRPLPIVSVEVPFEGIPSVLMDDSQGMHAAITHLIEVHGHHRIAFIRGPESHPGAQERYRAYVEGLAEHGIPLDASLVVQGNFGRPSGAEAMRVLLEERQVEFEALASVNDWMAIGALDVLKARGLRAPEDVAIVNFDNSPVSGVTTPTLTVVAPPFYKMGQRAVETLLAHIAGQPVPQREYISPTLIVRQSCGCPDPEVVQAAVGLVTGTGEMSAASFMTRRRDILSEMASSFVGIATEQVEQLLDTFDAELRGESPGVFVSTLERILHQVAAADGDVAPCQGAISVLRRHVLPYLGNREDRDRAEDLWQQARVTIGEAALLTQARRQFQAGQQVGTLREISQTLLTTFEMASLMNTLAQQLPQLGIPSCYLSLYEGKDMPPEWSRLMLAYDERERAELEAGGRRFPSRQLVPGDLLPHERQYGMIVQPLYYRENQLGFALFELGLRDGTVSETLRAQLSGSLNVIQLWQEREAARIERERLLADLERRALQLQTAAEVSRAASSILNVDELLPQVVELIRERFDLYYVGLFLVEDPLKREIPRQGVDETGQWAVLRAGTGEAGRKMLEASHKLEVGGASMIGWCIANSKARIALDVGEEAVRFASPLLPRTRSEMALPLVSRGRVTGAMTIQSAHPTAFTQEDTTILQTMADQVANAIENARLFEETKSRLTQLTALQEITRAVASTLELDKLLNLITQRATALLQGDGGITNLVNWEKKEDEVVTASGSCAHTVGFRSPLEDSLSGWVTLHNQPIISNQLQNDNRADMHVRSGEIRGQNAAIAPLTIKDQVIGTLVVMDKQGGFDQADLDLLIALANQAATAIESARLFEQTRAAEERFALAVQGSDDGLWDWDIKGNSLYWSPRLKEMLGYADDELQVNFDVFDSFLHPDDKERVEAALEAHLKHRVPYDVEQRQRTKSGEYRWYRARGQAVWDEAENPIRMLGFTSDITERKQAEAERERLLADLAYRALQLQTAAEVSRAASSILSLDELLPQTVELIRDRFNLYYVGLFLVDETERYAVLRAGTGEAGQKMLAASHKLKVGSSSMIGWCIANGKARIALDVGEEAVRFASPLLPLTRSEMALPLVSRGRVIGAMTVQSTQEAAFSDEDITTLQTLADQVANAIENAHLFSQTRAALAEVESTHQRYLHQQWEAFLTEARQGPKGYVDRPTGLAPAGEEWTPEMEQALVRGAAVTLTTSGDADRPSRAAIAVPIKLRGELLGVLDFYDEGTGRTWGEGEQTLVEALADQIALALENARLFEQTQQRAQREQLVTQITTKMRAAPDVESILRTTVHEIRRALGTSHGVIRLGTGERVPAVGDAPASPEPAHE